MYHYPLKLTMRSGEIIHGVALDTVRNENKEECIKIESAGDEKLVILNEIKQLEVTQDNQHIQKVVFTEAE
jgi:Rho-binding antiterminator